MKKHITTALATLIIYAVIYGIGFVKYKIWRAEHPHANPWTFFVSSGK